VISVASVDARLQRSIFSQYNENVDIAAPGSTILSTVPLSKTNALTLYGKNNRTYDGAVMIGSVIPQEGLEGSLVVCDNYGLDECDGPGGHVCLIERGWASFETKAKSCEDSGGVAAVIYNNIPKSILYSVLSLNNTETTIPVIGISAESAVILRNDTYISFQMKDGYAYADGTSMATPHVTGAVTELWRHCPLCSSFDVETCLLTTTLPLEDNEFSYGFLQTR
jgi:subtilisin family serine protease